MPPATGYLKHRDARVDAHPSPQMPTNGQPTTQQPRSHRPRGYTSSTPSSKVHKTTCQTNQPTPRSLPRWTTTTSQTFYMTPHPPHHLAHPPSHQPACRLPRPQDHTSPPNALPSP